MSVLVADGLQKRFGGVTAVDDVSISVAAAEVVGLIGPNGAGKTTVFNILTGFTRPDGGKVELFGQDLAGRRPDQIARAGIKRTFQNIRLFGRLTVLDNVAMGAMGGSRMSIGEGRRRAAAALEEAGFVGDTQALPAALPYASQRRVEVARAIASRPAVVLLDEPAAGMDRAERAQLAEQVLGLRDQGIAIVLVEHDVSFVARTCSRVVVLDFGRVIAIGTPDEVRADPRVIEAYLGVEDDGSAA